MADEDYLKSARGVRMGAFETKQSIVARKAGDIAEDLARLGDDCDELVERAQEAGNAGAEQKARDAAVTLRKCRDQLAKLALEDGR
jgi:hypothetical protein